MNTHNSPNAMEQSRQHGGKCHGILNTGPTHIAMYIIAICFVLLLFSLIGVMATLKDAHASGARSASTISVVKPPKPTPTPTMGTTPTPTVGITPTPTPTVGITPTPTPIPPTPTPTPVIPTPTPTPVVVPTDTPQPTQPPIGSTPTVAPTTPPAPIATSTPVPAGQIIPTTPPTPTQHPPSRTPTPSNGASSSIPTVGATVPPTTTQNNSTNTHTTPTQSSKPSGISSTTTLVIVGGTALLLLTGGSVAGFIFYNRRMTAQALASRSQAAPLSAEAVQAAWSGWQPSTPGSFGSPQAAQDAYAGASFAMANNIPAQPTYNGPMAPITPQPASMTSNTPMTPTDNPVYQQQVQDTSSTTMTDPALEAMMRQAQVGIFLIPGKE